MCSLVARSDGTVRPVATSESARPAPTRHASIYGEAVPLIGSDDRLPFRPERVVVAGASGSGKTTVARHVHQVLELPYVEIDALFHGPNWTPSDTFFDDVTRFSAEPQWVTEWQYEAARPVLASRADLLVWLDLPRAVVMRQVVWRTLRRRVRREVLWNGNREPALRTAFTDREHIVRWAWSTHHQVEGRITALQRQRPELLIVRLRTRADVQHWLSTTVMGASEPGR